MVAMAGHFLERRAGLISSEEEFGSGRLDGGRPASQ